MTLEREAVADLFGLSGTFPRPGWVVLDSARDHRFTGEIVFDVIPEVRVYLDRGRIYLAERVNDPSLGARLVDAGVINAAQLEHGAMRIGDLEHLGRLFERVPSVDRHAVLIITELMNEECVAWLARQNVRSAESTPYRHHPSGVHRWDRPDDAIDLSPGDPLPAPEPTAEPVEIGPPEPLFGPLSMVDDDDMIQWNEPSWLDERATPRRRTDSAARHAAVSPNTTTTPAVPTPTVPTVPTPTVPTVPTVPEPDPAPDPVATFDPVATRDASDANDWVDRLSTDGLPLAGSDPLASPATLPVVTTELHDRFELIWPSGEIDEQFGATDRAIIDRDPDHDRVGPTARVARVATVVEPSVGAADPSAEIWVADRPPAPAPSDPDPTDEAAGDSITDQVVLSVRRAVASIETGSLAARRRLASDPATDLGQLGPDLLLPGRIAARAEQTGRPLHSGVRAPVRSVFDEAVPAVMPTPDAVGASETGVLTLPPRDEPERVSALRRLIGGLRRR